MLLYPNPTKDYVIIESDFEITNIKVLDVSTRAIKVLVNKQIIDVSSLANGCIL